MSTLGSRPTATRRRVEGAVNCSPEIGATIATNRDPSLAGFVLTAAVELPAWVAGSGGEARDATGALASTLRRTADTAEVTLEITNVPPCGDVNVNTPWPDTMKMPSMTPSRVIEYCASGIRS